MSWRSGLSEDWEPDSKALGAGAEVVRGAYQGGVMTDRKRFGTGNKGVAFHCADCGVDHKPGDDRFFDNKEQKPKPLCTSCMVERGKNEANALPLDSLIALNKEILDELREVRALLKDKVVPF